MKAVVLCAGFGSRLGSLTKQCPKPLLPIGGYPLLAYILGTLKKYGFTEVALNTHFCPEMIPNYFGDGHSFGISIHYSFEPELQGTAGALWQLRDWLKNEDEFIVIYGDILSDQDLQVLVERHMYHRSFATLLLHHRDVSNSIVQCDTEDRIRIFAERPDDKERRRICGDTTGGLVNSAVQILSRRALEYIGEVAAFDLPKDVYVPMVGKEKIIGVPLTGRRVAIDSEERYLEAQKMVAAGGLFALGMEACS